MVAVPVTETVTPAQISQKPLRKGSSLHAFSWHISDLLSLVSAALSNLVSNVPAVLLFKPIIAVMPTDIQETAWLALAMSSTLAGNLTVLGSVANLIVVENAQKQGISITLGDYCRVDIPVTLLTLLIGIGWLSFSY